MSTTSIPRIGLAVSIVLGIASACPAQISDSCDDVFAREPSTDFDSAVMNRPVTLNLAAVQDAPAPIPPEPEDDWRVDVTVLMWLTAMSGDIRRGPLTADVDASFSDIVDASDSLLAFTGRLEVRNGKWAGFIEGMYANIGADDVSGPLGIASIDVATEIALMDFGLMYRVLETPSTNGGGRPHSIDVYAAGRYQELEIELDPSVGATREGGTDWIDPIIGARGTLQLSDRLDVTLAGDIGGFGVSSDITWSLKGAFGWHFEMFGVPSVAYAGYAALGTDYSEGSGLSRFEWDIILHGPVLGLTLSF